MYKICRIMMILVAFCASLSAQQTADVTLDSAWLQNDLAGVKFLIRLMPIESHSIAELRKRFETVTENTSWFDDSNLGFGARRVKLNMVLGYTTIYIDFLVFRNTVIHYKIGADVSEKAFNTKHGDDIKRAWKENGAPDFKLEKTELTFEKDFPQARKTYYTEVGKELGAMKVLDMPRNLDPYYKLLTDPFENSEISFVACSDGKPAIDALEDARRVDLIENVLRGYNPGGRIYAAISLLRMQREGRRLTPGTKKAIAKVLRSDASVTTCWGDTGTSGLTARDVVPEYVRSKDWYLLRK